MGPEEEAWWEADDGEGATEQGRQEGGQAANDDWWATEAGGTSANPATPAGAG